MEQKKRVELVELEYRRKWEYLRRYYEAAGKFYDIHDSVVSEEEIDECIRKFKRKPYPEIRKVINLKDWKYTPDAEDRGVREGYFSHDYDESKWENVSIPHSFSNVSENPVLYGKTNYPVYLQNEREYFNIYRGDTQAWYKTRFPLDVVKTDEVVYLRFGSVNLKSDVWLNDYPVMTDHLGLFPFEMEVTDELKTSSARNPVVAVRVSNTISNVPHIFYNGLQCSYFRKPYIDSVYPYDWADLASGGLAEEVTLSVINRNHIQNVFIHTDRIDGYKALLSMDIDLQNHSRHTFTGSVDIEISEWNPVEGTVLKRVSEKVRMLPLNNGNVRMPVDFDQPALWTIDAPNMYLAHFILKSQDGTPLDDLYETFGIRTIELKGSYFYLNGNKIVLQGTHDVCNYFGEPIICPSDRMIVKDMLLHKKMGANCSRWPSDVRMHYTKIAQFCDQFGFMLSWAGYFEIWSLHAEAEMHAVKDVGETIRSLRNHPSIIIWEMGDEALMSIHDYRRFRLYELIYDLVSNEDVTRPIIPSGFYSNELVDTIMVDYPDKTVPEEERRKRILEEYPVFNRERMVWDFHHCPCLPPFRPTYEYTEKVKEALGGLKPTVFTEFGTDGLPNPANVADVYSGFRWAASAFISGNKKILDLGCYGRELTQEDWKETQAYQAIAISGIINNIRQYPSLFAAYYFVCMFDVWTFYWGATDAHGNCKLLYFAARNHMESVFISGLHGNTTIDRKDILKVSISNYGESISDSSLQIIVNDSTDTVVYELKIQGITAEGNVSLTTVAEFCLEQLQEGLYSIQYYLYASNGELLGRMMELAFLE